jgi:hypothetical protein
METHDITSGKQKKNVTVILSLFLCALLTASGQAVEIQSDEEQILKLEEDWVRVPQKHDREGLDKIVAPEFTFIEPNGTIKDRQQSPGPTDPATKLTSNHFMMRSLKCAYLKFSVSLRGLQELLNVDTAAVTGLSSAGRSCG